MSDKLRSLRSLLDSLSECDRDTPGYIEIQSRIEALFGVGENVQCKRSLGKAGRCPERAVNEVETSFRTVTHQNQMSYWTPVCLNHTPVEDRNVRPLARSA